VPPGAASLAGAISALLADPARAAALAGAGAAWVAERCSWLAFVRSIEELYRAAGISPEAKARRAAGTRTPPPMAQAPSPAPALAPPHAAAEAAKRPSIQRGNSQCNSSV